MKIKLFFTFFLLLICNGLVSQSELYVLVKTPQNNTPTGSTGGGSCRIGDYRDGYNISHSQGRYLIAGNTVNVKIDYREGYNDDPGFGCNGRCGQYSEYCDGVEYERTFTHFFRYYRRYTGPDPIECTSNTCLPISYQAVLLPKLTTPADRRCERQPIFPQHSDGVNHNITGLSWQYFSAAGRWENIPNYRNRYPLNVSLLDIFGTNWRSQFNGNLQLRFRFTAPFTTSSVVSFSTYTIQLIECSPELIGAIQPQKTRCSYTNDGKFRMTVDRNLVPTEKLIVSLYVEDTNNPEGYSFLTQEAPTSLTTVSNGYSYTWLGDIPPNKYKIKYQTLKGSGTIAGGDPSWASLEFSNSFTIQPSNQINYTAQILGDETCYLENDGKIKVELTQGEQGRIYSYIMYTVNGTTTTLYKNWTGFSGSFETTINGLGKNRYKVQVRDNKNCYAE